MDQRDDATGYAMSPIKEVNMTNCYEHCKHFFKRCKRIHFNVLIAYWIMAGYLGPVDSVEEAYRKGHDILMDLIYEKKVLEPSNEGMVELATSSRPCWGHDGICMAENLGFVDFVDFTEARGVACTDGLLKPIPENTKEQRKCSLLLMNGNHLSRQALHFPNGLNYLAYFNPVPASLEVLLKDEVLLSVLLLRDCERLTHNDFNFINIQNIQNLTVLEISGSSHLTTIPAETISQLTKLQCLNLSHLPIQNLPPDFFHNLLDLRWVILRWCSELAYLPTTIRLQKLEVLDLFCCTSLSELKGNLLEHPLLQILDLSYTALSVIPFLSDKTNKITHLFLRNSSAMGVKNLSKLTSLMVVDLSGAEGVMTVNPLRGNQNLVILDLSQTGINTIEFLPDLTHLRKLILQNCTSLTTLPELSTLTNLEVLDLSCCQNHNALTEGVNEQVNVLCEGLKSASTATPSSCLSNQSVRRSIPDPIFSCNISSSSSGFQRFIEFISKIQQTSNSPLSALSSGLTYIKENIGRLERSHNSEKCEELIHELMDTAGDGLLKKCALIIVKLKLLIHPNKVGVGGLDEGEVQQSQLRKSKITKTVGIEFDIVNDPNQMGGLEDHYNIMTDSQKNCLKCFSVFPSSNFREERGRVLKLKSTVIKKRMLIHWWFGEGFINKPQNMGDGSTVEEVEDQSTIEGVGNQILKILEEKRFIEPVMKKGRESGSCCMQPPVHAFVTKKAMEEGFFDFDNENGKLAPYFTHSKRACLLKSHENLNLPSSYELWAKYTNSPKDIETFKDVHTMLNVNESIIDIDVEWFSRMKALKVLHLGSWRSRSNLEAITVAGQDFLKDLNKMERLRLVSLRGLSPIMKLPDSVGNLTDLRVLDLRGCCYLQKLPGDVGSLQNLVHLDITNCIRLSDLPKGISLLSKLEVLKGFRITDQEGRRPKQKKICILEDLSNLKNLTKLSLFVESKKFPTSTDVRVLKGFSNLGELKITWDRQLEPLEQQAATEQQEVQKCCKWPKRSSWVPRSAGNNHDTPSSNVRKLVLRCFPHETTPDWLVSSEWRNLEELHIIGGDLKTLNAPLINLPNVKSLRLNYLQKLDISWLDLRKMFPDLEYLEICGCTEHIFPCDAEGVWVKK